jgi:uncharacterized membrane protein YgdD (TMEM256/DUF423 family)
MRQHSRRYLSGKARLALSQTRPANSENEHDPTMDRFFFSAGAIAAFIAVALGAFGAHSLRTKLTPDMLIIFEVGVRYQMYHALALLALAWATTRWPEANLNVVGWCFIVGIVIFSGSLYLLSATGVRWLGAITPIGGLAFLAGWAILIWSINR